MMAPRDPAYARIEMYLSELLARGEGRTSPLPTEQALAAQFGVSRMTARQAFQRLVGAGLVVRHPGRGSFAGVSVAEDLGAVGRVAFTERWAAQGYRIDLRVLAFEERPAPPGLAERFRVEPGDPLCYVERLRLADGLPITWDALYLPAAVYGRVPEAALRVQSLVFALRQYGFVVGEGTYELHARTASTDEARILDCAPSATVFVRDTLFAVPDGSATIVGAAVSPSDRIVYRVHIPELP